MENQFTEIMVKKSTSQLMKIIQRKAEYELDAVKAAEIELLKRKEQIESDGLETDFEDLKEFGHLAKFKQSNDEELLNYYKNDFNKFSKIEIDFLTEELAKRNIEPKIWYYSHKDEKSGPYTSSKIKELAQKGEIDYFDLIWREGLDNWVEARSIEGLFTNKNSPPPTRKHNVSNQEFEKSEKPIGVTVASIIMFLTVPMWIIIAIMQAGASLLGAGSGYGLIAIWNVFFSIASIAMGIGILKTKTWGYRWGFRTAVVNVIWFGYNYNLTNLNFFIFLLLLELIIAILLLSNRSTFFKKDTVKEEVFL
jgi:hypothetical protein